VRYSSGATQDQQVVRSGEPASQLAAPPTPARRRRRRWPAVVALVLVFAALAAAGVTGINRYVSTYWAYRGFAAPSAPRSVRVHTGSGTATREAPVVMPAVQTFSFPSRALGGYRDQVDVVLPPGYAARRRDHYPVLYLLHGFPGVPSTFVSVGQVAATEATLVASGQMKPMIMVMPTGTRSYLTDTEWANGIGQSNAWDTMVAHDLVHVIDARYRTIRTGAARGIGGLSEGGYGALNIGLHHPGEFGLLESWSGYMLAQPFRSIFGSSARLMAYNSPAQWIHSVAAAVRADHTFVWFYCGAADGLAAQNRAFATELASLGIAHHFYTRPGGHSWGLWRSQVRSALVAASEHLSHD
jgi:enterochelin esterase-like enzyme